MKLIEYYDISHYKKLPSDLAMALCLTYLEINIKINQLRNRLISSSQIDFSGVKPTMNYSQRDFDDLVRFRDRKANVQKKMDRIEEYCSKNGLEFSSLSEYEHFKGQYSISRFRFDNEVNKFLYRLNNKFPHRIPEVISLATEHLGSGLTDNEYLRFGIISESNKLKTWYAENDNLEKNLKKFEEHLDEFKEFVDKVCGA